MPNNLMRGNFGHRKTKTIVIHIQIGFEQCSAVYEGLRPNYVGVRVKYTPAIHRFTIMKLYLKLIFWNFSDFHMGSALNRH